MVSTQQVGLPKYNTISLSKEFIVTRKNLHWVCYTWNRIIGNCVNGIRGPMGDTFHRPSL
jgi:hypothetical protein